MTEGAAQAKRLFDQERWPDAVAALERVISGETGDDAGNKELAEYLRGVALSKAGRTADAARAFLAIAPRVSHLKHFETLLWLVKLADEQPTVVRALVFYAAADAERFASPQQHEVHAGALFLLGRERFERGAFAEAAELFAKVDSTSHWGPLAVSCRERAKAAH